MIGKVPTEKMGELILKSILRAQNSGIFLCRGKGGGCGLKTARQLGTERDPRPRGLGLLPAAVHLGSPAGEHLQALEAGHRQVWGHASLSPLYSGPHSLWLCPSIQRAVAAGSSSTGPSAPWALLPWLGGLGLLCQPLLVC